jgi:hypothetical protein
MKAASSTSEATPGVRGDHRQVDGPLFQKCIGGFQRNNRKSLFFRLTTQGPPVMSVTYYVVVPFDRDETGDLIVGEAKEVPSAAAAERHAQSIARTHAGAVAFSRTGDPSIGEFHDAVVLAQFGEVDLNSLSE